VWFQIVNGHTAKLDASSQHLAYKQGLLNHKALGIDAHNAGRAAALSLEGIETRVTADVQHALARPEPLFSG
jgi:hypothetical protein